MSESNNTVLSRIFTQSTLNDLIKGKKNEVYETCIKRYLKDIQNNNNRTMIDSIYKYLKYEYRNEYFYKNTLLNKLLLGRHSLNTTTALSEVPIGRSKADFVLINGKAVVYEIKTELDSLDRLESQINDYFKAFNNVCVVSSESNYKKLSQLFNDSCVGIYILTSRDTVSVRKEAVEDSSKLDHNALFKLLRKNEFENIIIKHFGALPLTTQINYYKECLKVFKKIQILTAYKYTLDELKKRKIKEVDEFKRIPFELKSVVYFSNFGKSDYLSLKKFLNDEHKGE